MPTTTTPTDPTPDPAPPRVVATVWWTEDAWHEHGELFSTATPTDLADALLLGELLTFTEYPRAGKPRRWFTISMRYVARLEWHDEPEPYGGPVGIWLPAAVLNARDAEALGEALGDEPDAAG